MLVSKSPYHILTMDPQYLARMNELCKIIQHNNMINSIEFFFPPKLNLRLPGVPFQIVLNPMKSFNETFV